MDLIEIKLWDSSPIQVPFNFATCSINKTIFVPKEVVDSWKAGDKITVEGHVYTVSVTLLPTPGGKNLWS